jgi:small subunit ribosomal protein S9
MAEEHVTTKTQDATTATEEPKSSKVAPPLPPNTHYIWGTGRRKSSVARVRIKPGTGEFKINKRSIDEYFKIDKDRAQVTVPLRTLGMLKGYDVFVNVQGGGTTGQAGAISLGLARALAKHMPDIEHDLREKGLLTRDARVVERKKPGMPGARKRFQFSKR